MKGRKHTPEQVVRELQEADGLPQKAEPTLVSGPRPAAFTLIGMDRRGLSR